MRQDAERIVEEYSDLVLRLAFSYLHSVHDAKDICQDVLLKLLMRDEPFDEMQHEKAWVIRVTVNMCKNELASARRNRNAPLEAAIGNVAEAEEPLERLEVLDALHGLSPDQASAVFLRYYEGYKTTEIAQLIGKSEAAVAMELSRARARLRNILGEEVDGG